jgi:hypothetical protein
MISTVRLKNTLALHVFVNELIEELIKFVKSIPKYQELKLDGELLKNIMKQIKLKLQENKTLSDKQKENEVDKTLIVIEVYKTVFSDISAEILEKIEAFRNLNKDIFLVKLKYRLLFSSMRIFI